MAWQSEEQFRAAAGGGTIRLADNLVDAADASDHAAAAPALKCPCCGEVAVDIAGAQQLYQVDVKETGGKSHKADIPPCPIPGLDLPAMAYTVEPCGCRVSSDWAGGFSRELLSRTNGGKPKPLVDLTDKERAKKIAHYGDRLKALYALQAAYNTPEGKAAVDYWIVVCVDQMQRLAPSGHNRKPPAKPLDPKVADWASRNGFTTPPTPEQIASEVAVYRMTDGTVSTKPAYPGQEPIGYTAAPSAPKPPKVVFEDTDHEDAMAAAVLAAQAGLIKPGSELLNIFGGKGNTGVGKKAFGKPEGVFANAHDFMPPAAVVPQIDKTRNGQYAVRYGDIYKVFVTLGEAQHYSQQLAAVTPKFAGKMKPTFQTLPVEEMVPTQVSAPDPVTTAPPAPPVPKHAKKKRTIRKIQD